MTPHRAAQCTEVLTGKRYNLTDYTGRNLYITIADCPVVGTPRELWVTVPEENKPAESEIRTHLTTIAALFSEAREGGVPYTKLVKTMESTCYNKATAAAKILRLLLVHCPVKVADRLELEFASEKQKEN